MDHSSGNQTDKSIQGLTLVRARLIPSEGGGGWERAGVCIRDGRTWLDSVGNQSKNSGLVFDSEQFKSPNPRQLEIRLMYE